MPVWDPHRYAEFTAERARPFHDLLGRVEAEAPRTVVDLGCGSGELTVGLAERWPEAELVGLDSSPEMIAQAKAHAGPRLRFTVGDLATWAPTEPVDVVLSNAALQWVPQHRSLLPGLVNALVPNGWLAFQVPGNFDSPSHVLLHELAGQEPYRRYTADLTRPAAAAPADYLADLVALGCTVDTWETTYVQVLAGPDAVWRWMSGTGARPVVQALPASLRPEFERAYRAELTPAYPEHQWGTVLPFRRIFVVARQHRSRRAASGRFRSSETTEDRRNLPLGEHSLLEE